MLASGMTPRLPAGDDGTPGMLEAFAQTLYTSYNGALRNGRPLLSYQRAYAMSDQTLFSRVPDARPAWSLWSWTNNNENRMTVAIEGLTSLSQLDLLWAGECAVSATGLFGHVLKVVRDYGDSIFAELTTHAHFLAVFQPMKTKFVFAGFSLGAMIAEYLAMRFKATFNSHWNRVFKFGAARVGSPRWYNTNARPDTTWNVFLETDPINGILSWSSNHATLIANALIGDIYTYWAPGLPHTYIGMDGVDSPQRPPGSVNHDLITQAGLLGRGDPNSPWQWHRIQRYRYAMLQMAMRWPWDVWARFRYLEHADENNWAQQYSLNNGQWQVPNEVLPGDPPDTAIPQENAPPTDEEYEASGGRWGTDAETIRSGPPTPPREFVNPSWTPNNRLRRRVH